jgi:hypothetical protein
MELEITEDQQFFAETARRFLDERSTTATLREMRDDRSGSPPHWKQGAELWTSLCLGRRWRHHLGAAVPDLALVAHEIRQARARSADPRRRRRRRDLTARHR